MWDTLPMCNSKSLSFVTHWRRLTMAAENWTPIQLTFYYGWDTFTQQSESSIGVLTRDLLTHSFPIIVLPSRVLHESRCCRMLPLFVGFESRGCCSWVGINMASDSRWFVPIFFLRAAICSVSIVNLPPWLQGAQEASRQSRCVFRRFNCRTAIW